MSDFTVRDVREFFSHEYDEGHALYDGIEDFFWYATKRNANKFDIRLAGRVYEGEVVETYDDGREYERTMHYVFTIDGRTFKFPGKYYSHEGSVWDASDIAEGHLVTKPVMVWE